MEWRLCPYCNTRVTRTDVQGAPKALPSGKEGAETEEAEVETPAEAPVGDAEPLERVAMPNIKKKPKILVVDDDDGIKRVIQKALNQLPIKAEVRTASDGVEAFESIGGQLPDLVILDVMMPRMDGFQFCEKLRGDVRTAFIPVMMLTANADEGSRTKGYLVGTDDYVSKPFSVPELNARVMRLLRRTYGL